MPDHLRLRPLLEWSLAAFHAGFLIAALMTLLYATGNLGDLLSGLTTLLGLGLYAVFWLITWWTMRRATRGIAWETLGQPAALAGRLWVLVLWGGLNGLLFFLVIFGLIGGTVLAQVLTGQGQVGDGLSVIAFGGGLGSAVAFVVGAVVGLFFALLDGMVLILARWLAP